jgi:hypothetical protein
MVLFDPSARVCVLLRCLGGPRIGASGLGFILAKRRRLGRRKLDRAASGFHGSLGGCARAGELERDLL